MSTHSLSPLVLHVEGDDGDAHVLVRYLTLVGVELRIQRAIDGLEAMDILSAVASNEHERPALIIMDTDLDYMKGENILSWMRTKPELGDLHVLMLSERPFDERLMEQEANCTDYLVKPFDSIDLYRRIRTITDRYLVADATEANEGEVIVA